ncbi:hypothetical protein CLOP_g2916, partial [Closterium sp. NIES-67]
LLAGTLQKHVQHWPCVHLQESRLHRRCSPLQRWLSQVNEMCRFVTAGIFSHDILAFIIRSDQLQLLQVIQEVEDHLPPSLPKGGRDATAPPPLRAS